MCQHHYALALARILIAQRAGVARAPTPCVESKVFLILFIIYYLLLHRTPCVHARGQQRRPHSSDRACRFCFLQEYQTHRWHVYIRGANNEDLTPLIERVIFQLHPGEPKH